MPYLYLQGFTGTVALDIERGICVSAPKLYKGKRTRMVNLAGATAYIMDTPENLAILGVDASQCKAVSKTTRADGQPKRAYKRRFYPQPSEMASEG